MPNYENNNLHGTLYVTFDVEFPKQEFTPEEKEGKQKRNLLFSSTDPHLSRSFSHLQTYDEYWPSPQIIEFTMALEGHSTCVSSNASYFLYRR